MMGLGLGTLPVQAQTTTTLSALRIELWPEFDRPAMLVILTGTLAPSVSLPATVTVHIPAASGGPSAVAMQDPSGKLLDAQSTATPSGDSLAVNLQTKFATFRVEYYDPALKIDGDVRDYTFQWTADFPVNAATLRVQEPAGAHGLSADPAVTREGPGDLGLNYYSAALGQLSAGQSVSLHLHYTKSTSTLSVDVVSKSTPAPLAAPTKTEPPRPLELAPILLAVAAGIGLLMIGGGVVALVRGSRSAPPRTSGVNRRRKNRRQTPSVGMPPEARSPMPASPRFCTQCGQALLSGDRFCRNCGTPVRS
jgi:hypothetical protein